MATKRKVKRFNGEEDSLALADENYGDGTTREERLAMVRSPSAKSSLTEDETSDYGPKGGRGAAGSSESTTAPSKQSFKDAFAAARGAKQGTFEWGGKKYTTAMAGEKSSSAPKGEQASVRSVDNDIAARASRNTRTGPSADELESYSKQQAVKRAMTPPSKEDTQKGLEIMAGAPGLKAISAAAKGLANRAPAVAAKAKDYVQPALSAPTKRLTGPAAKEAATDTSPKLLTGPKGAEVSSKGREEVTNPLMWAAGPKNAGKFKEGPAKAPKKPKKALDESDTSGGAIGYKKGGNVRGWGIARGARKAKIV